MGIMSTTSEISRGFCPQGILSSGDFVLEPYIACTIFVKIHFEKDRSGLFRVSTFFFKSRFGPNGTFSRHPFRI